MKSIYGTGNFNPRSFDRRPKRKTHMLYMWGIVLFLFAIIAVVLGGLYLFGSTPESFTGERIQFELKGDTSPQTAENSDYTLVITNNEEVAIETLELFIDWPDGAGGEDALAVHFISSLQEATSEANNTWQLGELGIGESKEFKFTSRFMGNANAEIRIPFTVTFKPVGFSSTYIAEHSELFTLGDPTIDLEITGPSVTAAGSEVVLGLRVSGDSLDNEDKDEVIIALHLGNEFTLTSTNPELSEEGVVEWKLSELSQEKGVYLASITAEIDAEVGEKVGLEAHLHLSEDTEAEPFLTTIKQIDIQDASIRVDIEATPAQGKKLQWGERLDYEISVKNTGTYVMRNIVIRMQVPNENLWKSSTLDIGNGGFYESGNVFWDATITGALDSVRPDKTTKLTLSLQTSDKPPRGFAGIPRMVASAEVTAKLGDQEVSVASEELLTNILADVEFDATAWYTSAEGATLGSGPHPPQTGQETTYAIIWTLGPTTSELRDLEFSAKLPSNISWKNDTNYSIGEISFNGSDREVTWKASKVPALELPTDIRFMISITPSSSTSSATRLLENTELKVTDDATAELMEFFGNNLSIGDVE
ncbi:hypothetical protein CL632_00095 [bacterium]|nr:hypothetical protein [bacterium]|tara:strand:+ start:9265 stop:11037 length:1773 start_codon:yes stop_codon:yes gene_type:complete